MSLFSGQGKIFIAQRNTDGTPKAFRYLGKTANGAKIEPKVDKIKRKESETGQRLTSLSLVTGKEVMLNFEIEEFSKENYALAFWSESAVIAAGTVTNEPSPTGLVDGDYFRLAKADISSLSITDSAGAPVTLVAGTDYEISNAKLGMIKLLNAGTFVQPFQSSYSNAQSYNIPLYSDIPGNYWLRFEGLNMANSGEAVLVELYNVQLDPATGWTLKGEDVATLPMAGEVLYDDTKESDTVLGTSGRIVTLS
ncbi:phage tail tube protein [Methylobacter marinus]|uniref:phage tail tube protein n=1 Tax=Methylobacter marinus TaxID=34058 RepID=UPI00037EA53C|nr:hypothetical protein [Methylobacter marinus]